MSVHLQILGLLGMLMTMTASTGCVDRVIVEEDPLGGFVSEEAMCEQYCDVLDTCGYYDREYCLGNCTRASTSCTTGRPRATSVSGNTRSRTDGRGAATRAGDALCGRWCSGAGTCSNAERVTGAPVGVRPVGYVRRLAGARSRRDPALRDARDVRSRVA